MARDPRTIVSIDQSPLWRPQLAGREELSRLLEELFRSRRGRRPASRLEVLFLSDALECSEADIEAYAAETAKPKASADSNRDPATAGAMPGAGTRVLRMQPLRMQPLRMQTRVGPTYSPTKPA